MVDSLQQLRQEARDLGLVPTEEAVGMADAIGDALDKVKAVISATVFEVGAALAPMLLPALETVKNIAGWFNRWAKENGAIIRTVAMIGAGLVAAGAVIIGIGATIFGIGSAFGLLATTITGVGAVLGFLLNPVTWLSPPSPPPESSFGPGSRKAAGRPYRVCSTSLRPYSTLP